jgi:Bacterial protein of unknown function (DUF885)
MLDEVAPGHFCHGQALRRAVGDVRPVARLRDSFLEGWAVYAEELALEEGFGGGDPRFAAGVALSALERAVRMTLSELERLLNPQPGPPEHDDQGQNLALRVSGSGTGSGAECDRVSPGAWKAALKL